MIPIPGRAFTVCPCAHVCFFFVFLYVYERALCMKAHNCVCIFVCMRVRACLPSSLPGPVFTFGCVVNVGNTPFIIKQYWFRSTLLWNSSDKTVKRRKDGNRVEGKMMPFCKDAFKFNILAHDSKSWWFYISNNSQSPKLCLSQHWCSAPWTAPPCFSG